MARQASYECLDFWSSYRILPPFCLYMHHVQSQFILFNYSINSSIAAFSHSFCRFNS